MSAFEADRFNRSRTSPKNSCQLPVVSCQRKAGVEADVIPNLREAKVRNLLFAPANKQRLPSVLEERLQQRRAPSRQHARANFYAMIQAFMI